MVLVTAGLILHKGRILLAQRRDEDPLGSRWEFPGGKIEPGESDEACLARELLEELGLEVSVGELLMESWYDYGTGTLILRGYWARWTGGSPTLAVHRHIEWVEPKRLLAYDLLPADVPIARRILEEYPNAV